MDDPFLKGVLTMLTVSDTGFLIIGLVIIVILFIGSALVSGSEVAYFSLHIDQIENVAKSQKQKNRILFLLQSPKRLLSTILILNNFINITIVMLSTYLVTTLLGDNISQGTLFASLTVGVTLLIVFFGEITPKVYANQNNLVFASKTARLLVAFFWLFKPLAWLLVATSNLIENRIKKKGYTASVDELNQALDLTIKEETTKEEKGILKGIVNFGTLSVKQIMKSRMDIVAIDAETNFHDLMTQMNKTGFSRIPIFKETIDKIEGILYIKDLLPYVNEKQNCHWQELLRSVLFVPETKKIDTLFKDFQEQRIHMAIVVDEYGGTSGLITMEDVIEEIVGEINDEFDEKSDDAYSKIDADNFTFDSKTSLLDFCKLTHVDFKIFDEAKGENESLGGLLLELNAKLPKAGDKIMFGKFIFTIVSVNEKRIIKVKVNITR